MSITAQMVKELRIKSSAGMMDCKKALSETNGDMDAAVDWLRKKGLATASKKSGRVASEGLVGICIEDNFGSIVEVNSETDFVARNVEFQEFVSSVAKISLNNKGDLDDILKSKYLDFDKSVQEVLTDKIAKIGENMSIRRTNVLSVSNGIIVGYIHNSVNENLGKIGVLVSLESNADKSALKKLGKELAMHIAATSPSSISVNDLSPDIVERERSVLIEQAMSSGKPEDIAKKISLGKMNKFKEENALLTQAWVMEPKKKVQDVLKELSITDLKIKEFYRIKIGE